MRAPVVVANETLVRACDRLRQDSMLQSGDDGSRFGAHVRSRVAANHLMELRTFAESVLDAVLPHLPGARAPHWRSRGGKARHGSLRFPEALAVGERMDRLRHSWAMLRYCGGVARRSDDPARAVFTAGWIDPATNNLKHYGHNALMVPTHDELMCVCDFYLTFTNELIAQPN